MTRKLIHGWLFVLTSLALLPGCQHFLLQHRSAGEDAKIQQELKALKGAATWEEDTPPPTPVQGNPPQSPPKPVRQEPPNLPPPKDWPPGKPATPPAGPLKGPRLDVFRNGMKDFKLTSFADAQPTTQQGPLTLPLPLPGAEPRTAKQNYAPVVEAMQKLFEGRQPEAIKLLEAYDAETQEFFLRLLPTLAVFAKKRIDELTPGEAAAVSEQLAGALWTLRKRSELIISKMCLCKRVHSYGVYEPLEENHAFLAGANERAGELVQLYVELKNFASEPTPTGLFMTKLACMLELTDGKGEKVWSHAYDRALTTYPRKTRLTDFYSNYRFYVPPLPPGQYRLKILIEDETNPEIRRVVHKSLDFRVTPIASQSTLR